LKKVNFFEDLACEYLKKKNFKILDRNYRCAFGEIDIIAQYRGILCFVEVKKRSSQSLSESWEVLSDYQKRRIRKTSLFYLYAKRPFYKSIRYDLLLIEEGLRGVRFHLVESAFDYEG